MSAMRLLGVGLVGPGLADWNAGREILAGRSPYAPAATVLPSPEALPATERRRAGKSVRVALGAGLAAAAAAGKSPRELASIFASSGGDGDTMHHICETLASGDRLISPTRFHNSVHNAPAGYWGIATGSMEASDTIAAFDGSFAAGLLEAATRLALGDGKPLVLVAYDAPYPEPLNTVRPIADAFGVGLVLARDGDGPALDVRPDPASPDTLEDAALEHLRRSVPAARALPLLAALAGGRAATVRIEYLDGTALAVDCRP